MTIGIFYLTLSIISACLIWLVWQIGFKSLFLDAFRERLFELRGSLFSMAESGLVDYNDDAYRAIEIMLNGFIRYAHRLSFPSYISSVWENFRAKREDKDYVDFGQQLMLKISRLKPEAQAEFIRILNRLRSAIALYLAASSAIFKIFLAIYLVAKAFRAKKVDEQVTQQVWVIQRDVYFSARNKAVSMQ